MVAQSGHKILRGAFFITGLQKRAALHVRSCFQLGHVQIELKRRFEPEERITQHRVGGQVEASRKRKERPHQHTVFIEKIGFVSVRGTALPGNGEFLAASPVFGELRCGGMLVQEVRLAFAESCRGQEHKIALGGRERRPHRRV